MASNLIVVDPIVKFARPVNVSAPKTMVTGYGMTAVEEDKTQVVQSGEHDFLVEIQDLDLSSLSVYHILPFAT